MRLLLPLLIALAIVPARAQPAPDSLAASLERIAEQHAARDVVLEVVFSPDGVLLSWRCGTTPHPSFCAPTAAIAAWSGAPTQHRSGRPDVFALPVAFWLSAEFDREASGPPAEGFHSPRIPPSPYESEYPVEDVPVLLGGLSELQSRVRYPPSARADSVEGRVFVQFVVDERGRVHDTAALPATCVRAPDDRLCSAALDAVRPSRFVPGRQRGRPVLVRFVLPVTFRLSGPER